MEHPNLEKWKPMAWALEDVLDKLPVPFYVLAGEGLDVARFAQRYWEPSTDTQSGVVRPGLSSAVGAGQFSEGIAKEILELGNALQSAQSLYRLSVNAPDAAPVERAQYVMTEMRDVLQWYFDDGEENQNDAQLEQISQAHDSAASHDAIAAALFDYATLAEQHRDAIDGLGGFDAKVIDEARKIAQALRERSAGPATIEPPPGQRQALELRNRIATLLYDRMQRVRSAARFVFRRQPDLVRKVTSAYARQQRAAYRRRKRNGGIELDDTAVAPAAQPAEASAE